MFFLVKRIGQPKVNTKKITEDISTFIFNGECPERGRTCLRLVGHVTNQGGSPHLGSSVFLRVLHIIKDVVKGSVQSARMYIDGWLAVRMSEWNLNDDGDAGGHVGSTGVPRVSQKNSKV